MVIHGRWLATPSTPWISLCINKNGIYAERISTIVKMKLPSNITELRRLLGMMNQLGKFSLNIRT